MNYCKKIIACMVLGFMALFLFLPTTAKATETTASDSTSQLAIEYQYDEVVIEGADFYIYYVGEVSEAGVLSLTGQYADYPVEINGLSDTEFQLAASTLYEYVQMDSLTPDYKVVTDDKGFALVQDLKKGVYLVAGQNCMKDGKEYITAPQLVVLPYKADANVLEYYVTLIPKCTIKEEQPEPLTLKVLKKWNDNGNASKRPSSLTVHLLNDGKIYKTVKLTSENNWRHTWTDLDPDGNWSVVEIVPTNYKVTIQKQGITYLIENTYDAPSPPDDTPSKIPQTGLLWWPVPVLGFLGIALIGIGCISRRKG